MMTMKTMYVEDETEPAVFLFAFNPRLIAPPTTGQFLLVLDFTHWYLVSQNPCIKKGTYLVLLLSHFARQLRRTLGHPGLGIQ